MKIRRHHEALLHVLVWIVLFLSPLMSRSGERMSLTEYLFAFTGLFTVFAVFYINYFFLVPKLFMNKGKRLQFLVINAVLIVGMAVGQQYWMRYYRRNIDPNRNNTEERVRHRRGPSMLSFLIRDMFNFALTATTATAIGMSKKWSEIEQAQHEAESARVEAELMNLRSQINPHFLLNTLNNIYALTAFDQTKAQDAIMELSQLLRHILYDNQQPYVKLTDEVQFIGSYVKLMKIRVPSHVRIEEDVQIPQPCAVMIAPLIFISLIENAFKHGISPTEESFINISISASDESIVCNIENSNHPKDQADRSGHGIGLEQVARRLDLSYPGKYSWEKGLKDDGKTYFSRIEIFDTKIG